jgi:hypothetical protein
MDFHYSEALEPEPTFGTEGPPEDRALWFDLMLTSEDREWMEQMEAGFREVAI